VKLPPDAAGARVEVVIDVGPVRMKGARTADLR